MIKYSQHAMIKCILKVFNNILTSGLYPKAWCKGYIVPIFKSGKRTLPENYRGITIMGSLAKLFNLLLNSRFVNFLEKRKLIDIKQIGFKRKSRTSDHIFILRSLIEKYSTKSSKLFACFIDFRKAFDLVDHTLLLFKMMRIGIGGNVIRLFKDMYINKGFDISIKSENFVSSPFKSKIGVRQGDHMSPTLFKIFINDIADYIDVNETKPSLNDVDVSYLMYADDIVILASSENDLRASVKGLENFCNDWGLIVNTDKSKVMVFNTKNSIISTNILYNNMKLEDVTSYKYLGLLLHISGKYTHAKQDLSDRSHKAMFKLMSCFKDGKPSFITGFHLFDSCKTCTFLWC